MMYPTEQLTLFAADTRDLANLSVQPGSDKARMMTAISGRRCLELSVNSGPLGYLEKMLLDTLHWGSMTHLLTWQVSATRAGHSYFRLRLSGQDIGENECSLWPTPTACEWKGRVPNSKQQGLAEKVKMWPTPQARDWKGSSGRSLKGMEYDLPTAAKKMDGNSGQLNPTWVEWLMGFPPNWTEVYD